MLRLKYINKKKMLKCGHNEVTTKNFYGQRQITDTFKNEVVTSDKVLCNHGKDCRYIVGYQVNGALISLFIKMPKNIFSHSMSLRKKGGRLSIKKSGMILSHSYLKNWRLNR